MSLAFRIVLMNRLLWVGCGLAVRYRWVPLILALVAAPAWSAPVTIVDNGSPANRVDIVFLGDGYTQANLDAGIYDQHIQGYLGHMFSSPSTWDDPFQRYNKFFNVHKIDVVSNQSGADIPLQDIFVDTALDARYNVVSGTSDDRLLTVSTSKANTIRNQELIGTGITADMQLVTVNHTKYGGSGGSWAVYSGGNSSSREIALHELGHSFSNLADEYVSFSAPYPSPEPVNRNATKNPAGEKWSHWVGFDDPRGSNLDIGVFQGALFYSTGVYRPSLDSKMRNLNRPFDAVSREAIIHDIYDIVDPLDDWLSNSVPLADEELWVDVVDPDVINLQWYVDDVLVDGATSESFDLADFGFGAGTYDVRAHAYDGVIDHAFAGGMLDLVRSQLDLLQQDVSWMLTLTSNSLFGDYNGNETIDAADYTVWRDAMTAGATELLNDPTPGAIDQSDYDYWREHFGDVLGGGAGSAAVVPEPSSLILLLTGIAAFLLRK